MLKLPQNVMLSLLLGLSACGSEARFENEKSAGRSTRSEASLEEPRTDEARPDGASRRFGFVTGRVIATDTGDPLFRAFLSATSIQDPPLAVDDAGIVTGRRGRYEKALRAGEYEIMAGSQGYKSEIKRIRIDPRETVLLNFRLDPK